MISVGVTALEIAASRGVDFAWFDLEHTADGLPEVYAACRAADAEDLPLLVRVGRNDPHDVASVLDAGAVGVLVPHVTSAADARRVSDAARYAPDGERSMSYQARKPRWRNLGSWSDYWPRANAQTVVGVIVEDGLGLEHLEEIIAEPGVDLVLLGTGDLAQSLGIDPATSHPTIERAMRDTAELCRRHGKAALCGVTPEALAERYAAGFRVFSCSDTVLFADALEYWLTGTARAAGAGSAGRVVDDGDEQR